MLTEGSNATAQVRSKPVLSIPVKLLRIFSNGLERFSRWQQDWPLLPIKFLTFVQLDVEV